MVGIAARGLSLVEPYLADIAQGALMYASAHGTTPEPVALIGAIGIRESLMGALLTPKGIDGCGDWTARVGHWLDRQGVKVVRELPPPWRAPKRNGKIIPGPYAIPHDGKGWGRGTYQLDFLGDVRDLIAPAPWPMDRQAAACCAMLAICRRDLAAFRGHPLYDRAVAARYNTTAANVIAGFDAGDPDIATTPGPSGRPDYGADVLTLRDALIARYPDRLHMEVA